MEKIETEIDGITYRLTLWPTSEALEWKERLMGLGLEPVGKFLSADMDVGDFGFDRVSATFLERLKGIGGYAKLLTKLIALVDRVDEVDGVYTEVRVMKAAGAGAFDNYYRAKTLHLDRLAMWVIVENFRDFGDAVRWIERGLGWLSQRSSSGTRDGSKNEPAPQTPEIPLSSAS